ncbi:hypothetical protein GCM10007874_11100 [Labrys miyagiensis]|uniref:Uncharacterized protein n=1 Tax=Labrys miyagiensis TaxID=346912 RepID=A0ABQ6CE80_9HYPH|nr:hypothetical protein GCM10007874_11100 [Labrys miyagiensis]
MPDRRMLACAERGLGKIRRCLAQDLVRLAKLAVLPLKLPDPRLFRARRAGANPVVPLCLPYAATLGNLL